MSSPSDSESNDAVLVDLDDFRDFNVDNILPLPLSDIVEIKKWLQPTGYDLERSEYSRHRVSHLVGTGNWLKSTTTYQQWHNGDNGLLWVKGIPGSGKSVLAASIIHQLQKNGIPVIFFFFRQIIDANHQPVAALRDWLCQVLGHSPPLQVKLKGYIKEKRPLDSLSPSDLWKDIKLALATFTKIYCVTDALDEMDQGNDEFLHMLVGLGQWRPSNVKVLITSRPVEVVEKSLRLFAIPNIRLEERLVDLDIASYVQYKLRHSSVPRESWSIIEEAIPGRANGLFLYAKLSMDAFLEPGADAYEVLKALPADLNVMYNDLLREHARRSAVPDDLQLLVLQFVTHATRPLRILEIADMAKTVMVNTPIEDRSLKETKALVRAACGPLLEILPDETVSVVHHSFTEFLKGLTRLSESDDSTYPILQMGQTHKCLAIACLKYIQSGYLSDQTLKAVANTDEKFHSKVSLETETRLQYPFLEYAAKNWYTHVRRAAHAGTEMSLVYTMLDNLFASEQIFRAWLVATWPQYKTEGINPLHVAAWAGLDQYTTRLLEKGYNIEVRDSMENTPLYWAATCGRNEVVQVLLANGADPNAEQHQGYKPLHLAARKNHAQVAKTLLAAGVDPLTPKTKETPGRRCGNAPTSRGHTPLMYACHNGHVETVAEFLPFLENSKSYPQALVWGAERGQGAVVELILQHPRVDVNATYRGDTALFKACATGDQKTINALLRAGADPNIFCNADKEFSGVQWFIPNDQADQYPKRGHTALHVLLKAPRAGKETSLACIESLLQVGADIHARSHHGRTALHYAFQYQTADIVKLLLDSGADPTAEDDYGATPLHAGWKGDSDSLPVLLSTGLIDINKTIGKSGKTPLLCRLDDFDPGAALALLEYNPDVNIVDVLGNGPLHAVFARGSGFREDTWGRVIDLLIALGANPNAKNREGNTPLHVIRDQHTQFISKLLDAGADLEARNHNGQTVLFKHITADTWKEDQVPLFQTWINLGSRIDARDSDGRTLLHQCCNDINRLEFLISIGLDPLAIDYRGNSLLMEVAAAHCEDDQSAVIDHLIGLGLDIDQPNHLGRTVLHTLCARARLSLYSSDPTIQNLAHVMRLCKNINPADCHGVQPLHLAATISESHVFELLNAGADMFGVTHEGMSVLHIAARARQPNIIALFFSELSNLGEPTRTKFLNQQNYEGQTALHFACRSGHLETVKALLEAGANPKILDTKKRSPFRFCAQFEAEQQLWCNNDKLDRKEFLDAAGVLLNDNARPFVDPSPYGTYGEICHEQVHTEHNKFCLDEIFELLFRHGPLSIGKNECFQNAFHHALSNRYEYTVDCLMRLQARLPDLVPDIKPSSPLESNYLICKYRLNATKQALKEVGDFHNSRDSEFSLEYNFMEDLILNGHCDLFEERIGKKSDLFQLSPRGNSLLHCLVIWGYGDLLARVCNRDAALKFDDHDWCLKAEEKFDCRKYPVEPLLMKACARELPNMDVVELLVEKFSVSLNAQRRTTIWNLEVPKVAEGPLHLLAAGHSWWHVDKALPYLIKNGANLELRDENSMTPLHIALDSSLSRGPFYKIAIKILIEGGADVNAVDAHGKTCLSKVGDNVELAKLLLAHGAHVSAAAVFSAIEGAQIETLRSLLSHVDCANLKQSETGFDYVNYSASAKLLYSETSPLLYAALPRLRSLRTYSVSSVIKAGIMATLLDHGADPFATFSLHISSPRRLHFDRYDSEEFDSVLDGPDSSCSKSEKEPRTCTVIHETFKEGGLVSPFFQLPSLQLEIRDSAGCTLLLAASQNMETLNTKIQYTEAGKAVTKSVLQELIDRGADIMAQDNDGNTTLHHISRFDFDPEFFETLKEMVSKAPGLLYQPDCEGNTFFHRILAGRKFSLIDDLLKMGVDPLHPDSNGDTALHHLAGCLKQNEIQDYFKRFLDAGIDINSRNNQGDTPLFKYIENGVVPPSRYDHTVDEEEHKHTETVFDFFEERGADFFTRNNLGSSLLHLLASKKANSSYGPQIPHNIVRRFRILMSRGLDPMAEDARQRTSLDVAAACGSEHILKLFARKPME